MHRSDINQVRELFWQINIFVRVSGICTGVANAHSTMSEVDRLPGLFPIPVKPDYSVLQSRFVCMHLIARKGKVEVKESVKSKQLLKLCEPSCQ